MVKVEGYLTEKKLYDVLCAWAGTENVAPQPMVTGTRMRYDYEVKHNGRHIMVEYDGDSHFRDANTIMRDDIKDNLSETAGREVVRIPYFVQLDKVTFKHFFNEDFDVVTEFPQGFINTKMLPASFCGIGVIRAQRIMDSLPLEVREQIALSLENKAENIPDCYVYARRFYGEKDGVGQTWNEFITEARRIHGSKYIYVRSL
jgi:hypothetical protein